MAQSIDPIEHNISAELAILETLTQELEDYIVKDNVYRTVLVAERKGNRTLKMSGGDLLARINSLAAIDGTMAPDEKARLNRIATQVQETKQALKTRFHKLLGRELKSRLGTLNWSREERAKNEENRPLSAEQQNLMRIAAIRKELNKKIPAEASDEMDALEEELQAAIEALNQGSSLTE